MQGNESIRQHLLERRRSLLRRYRDELERAEEELASRRAEAVEQASEQWDAQLLGHLGDGDVRAILAVVDALARLDRGTYGVCASCGEPIAAARLVALPEAATCIDCADQRSASSSSSVASSSATLTGLVR